MLAKGRIPLNFVLRAIAAQRPRVAPAQSGETYLAHFGKDVEIFGWTTPS
jgi:hypothetical protein